MNSKIIYHPLTAAPFKNNPAYKEIPPCRALMPYIRCFWGSEQPYRYETKEENPEIVIPDTCVDIIYHMDYSDNTITGGFCGVNDKSFYAHNNSKPGHMVSTFAVRFYAWSAYVFSEDSLKTTINGYFDVKSRFGWIDTELRNKLFELKTLQARSRYVERMLANKLENVRHNEIVDSTINNILLHKGSLEVSQLTKDAFVSSRQLERLFHEYVGITPKKLSNLVRYQFLWRDILYQSRYDIMNFVYKYGYTDQAHLLHEFKRYHSMDINAAKIMAFSHVENIQDRHGKIV